VLQMCVHRVIIKQQTISSGSIISFQMTQQHVPSVAVKVSVCYIPFGEIAVVVSQ
jgi:hypothetical protein